MRYIEHITTEGDRWDLIAHRYYGDASRLTPLAEANEQLRLLPVLPSGLVLRVPILDDDADLLPDEVPPWKR